MTYNSVSDRGLAYWHRDIHSIDQALLSGLQQDLLANRSSYWQWNIPLYDEDVLWATLSSRRRPNTEEKSPACSTSAELKAGDGIVYTNVILH